MVPLQSQAGSSKSNRCPPRFASRLGKLHHVHGPPLYTHPEDDKEVECGHEFVVDGIEPWRDSSQCHANQTIDPPTCHSWCSPHHKSDPCACCESGESPLYQRRATSLKRRLRVGSWVAMMVLLLLAACFIVREFCREDQRRTG